MLGAILRLLDRHTLLTMGSALVLAALFVPWSDWNALDHPPFIVYLGFMVGNFGDTLFHEMGHATFSLLFGSPAIPSIFTVFGTDKAGGMSVPLFHSWVVQIGVWGTMAYGCWWLRAERPMLFWPCTCLTLLCIGLAFTSYPKVIVAYMGHGSAILCGAVLLYRAWLDIIVRTAFERWWNAFFGFFIVLNNFAFSYKLLYSAGFKAKYENTDLTMDFVALTDLMPHWRVHGIAQFTLIYAALALILSFALAVYFYEDEHYNE